MAVLADIERARRAATNSSELRRIARVVCPTCKGYVNVFAESGEKLDDGKPVKCPECKLVLNELVHKALKEKR